MLVMSIDGGNEEISNGLKEADRASHRAKQHLLSFWRLLSSEGDIAGLPNIVASVEKYERKADAVYQKVKSNFRICASKDSMLSALIAS